VNYQDFVRRRFVGSALAFVAGASLTLSFAPFEWWPVAILAPALLMLLWDGASPRRAAVLGFWFNFGTFAVGTYWLFISLHIRGHAPIPLALLMMLCLAAIMGAYHALLGWAVAKFLPARGPLRWMLGIPGAWLLIEWFRSWFLTGFGWLALGYAHTDNWLGSLAPVIGQYGLGLVTLVMAGALLTLLHDTRRNRIVAAVVLVTLWGTAFALRGIEWTRPFGQPIEIAVVQGAVPQDEKWIDGNLDNIVALYQARNREAHGADIIFWPESAIPDLANNHIHFYRDVYAEASAHGSSMIMGTMRADTNPRTGEEEYFNSVLAMDKATPGIEWHDKHHLVPFAEFFPVPKTVRSWLRLMDLPYSDFNRGAAQQAPLSAGGQKIAAGVCYEDAYGATLLPAMHSATMLANVTNDAWFGRSIARYQHLQISRQRAMETGRPMVRAANDGVSAVIGYGGKIIATAPEYEASVLRAKVQPRLGLTPYARVGNWPAVCLALAFCLIGAYFGRRRKQA
jgi:apolipoprotein N-acyltransferase